MEPPKKMAYVLGTFWFVWILLRTAGLDENGPKHKQKCGCENTILLTQCISPYPSQLPPIFMRFGRKIWSVLHFHPSAVQQGVPL